jgi:hypothetical protein
MRNFRVMALGYLWLAGGGCARTAECRPGTLLLRLWLSGEAMRADTIAVDFSALVSYT